jgi:hypothetical protein
MKKSHRERILKQVRISLRKGIRVVPVPQGRKGPILPNWPELVLTEGELSEYFSGDDNLGWITGTVSGNLVDIDLDCPDAVSLAKVFLPKTERIHGRRSRPASHYYYKVLPIIPPIKYTDAQGKSLVEIRSERQQTLVPPSIHPSDERLTWEAIGEPAVVDPETLRRCVDKVAAGALLVGAYPKQGSRHDFANALGGTLLREGWEIQEICEFVEVIGEAAGDEETPGRVRDVIATGKRLLAGGSATGVPTLALILGTEVASRFFQFLRLRTHKNGPSTITVNLGWPDPAPLNDELPPVDSFDLQYLPESFRPLVEDVSERTQTPPDYAAAAAVVALAGCVNRRASIQPKAMDDSWRVVPNLWGAIVAPPGYMKSPILHAMTAPLNQIEDFWRADHKNRLAEFESAKVEAEIRQASWRELYKKALKEEKDLPIRPDDSLGPPAERRLITTDSTFEKLHEILSQNPAGILTVRDELTGWLAGLDREGREGERGFFLQAWSGDASYTIDRIGRGSIHVPAVCVSLLGNIQPARLRWYLGDALQGGANDDGLFQRFQLLVWPDGPKSWTLVDRSPNVHAAAVANRVYSRLANLPVDDPTKLRFDPSAQELFFKWLSKLEIKIRGDKGLAPPMIAHLSKYRSLMPSLAALFEMADRIADNGCLGEEPLVDIDHARQAVAFCGYLESHANRVYSCLVSPESRAAIEMGRNISNAHFPEKFTTREIYLKGWAGLDSPEKARNALAVLEDAAWVRRVENPPSPAGGRPSETWSVNPKVRRRAK